jgi:hypothetical protein
MIDSDDIDLNAEFEDEDGYENDIFDYYLRIVRAEYHQYAQSRRNKRRNARLYHARTLFNDCDNEETEANVRTARIAVIHQISRFAEDFMMSCDHCRTAPAEYAMAEVYTSYNWGIRCRLGQKPSIYESIGGETSRVRHLEAHQLAVYVQEESNRHYDIHGLRNEAEHIAHLPRLADLVVERIKSFAPELIVAGNSETRILRVIADAAWAA